MINAGGILRRARVIELRARRLVQDLFTGPYRSVYRGRGIEFDEIRDYQPGDDVRSIDWHATARTGRVQIKQQVEERHQTILLAVDISGSAEFGSTAQSKRELAAELGAVLALSAVRNNDRVGLLLFTDRTERFLPPRAGRFQALSVVLSILGYRARRPGTRLASVLQLLGRSFPRGTMVFLISDFLDEGFERALRVAARRHDVIALRVEDPLERELPPLGWLVCDDAETGEVVELNTAAPAVREALAKSQRERGERLRRLLRQSGVDAVHCQTGRPYQADLLRLLETRGNLRRAPV